MPNKTKKGYRIREAFDRTKEYSDFGDRKEASRRGPAFLDSPLNKAPSDVDPSYHGWFGNKHWNDPTNRGSFGPGSKDKMPGADGRKPKGYKRKGVI